MKSQINPPCLKSPLEIKYELDKDGFSVIQPSDIPNISIFLDDIQYVAHEMSNNIDLSESNQKYPGGSLSIISSKKLHSEGTKALQNYNQFCLALIPFISNRNYCLDAIYSTVDTPQSNHIAQKPHFDRIPTLKFMLYVNDLTDDNGGFRLSPGSHHYVSREFPKPRPPHGDLVYFEKTRQIPDYINKNLQTISGFAGTVIIFDTDCIHHQGIVKNGICCIVRAHYRESTKRDRLLKSLRLLRN